MLQIAEIDQTAACFLNPVTFTELDDRLSELLHQRSRLMQLRQKNLGWPPKQRFLQLQQALLHIVPQLLDRLLQSGVGCILLASLKLSKGYLYENIIELCPGFI